MRCFFSVGVRYWTIASRIHIFTQRETAFIGRHITPPPTDIIETVPEMRLLRDVRVGLGGWHARASRPVSEYAPWFDHSINTILARGFGVSTGTRERVARYSPVRPSGPHGDAPTRRHVDRRTTLPAGSPHTTPGRPIRDQENSPFVETDGRGSSFPRSFLHYSVRRPRRFPNPLPRIRSKGSSHQPGTTRPG